MYEIIKDGAVLSLTESPNYIRLHPDGFYILCEQSEAQGVALDGTPYHLFGRKPMDGLETVVLVEIDSGRILQEQETVNSIAFVTLAEAGSIDDVTAGEHIDAFAPWAVSVAYTVGQLRKYGEKLYRCITAHTSQADWTPDAAVSLWSVASDPAKEYPSWSQPMGAHDAYSAGDKVTHSDKKWTSDLDGNVWEPGVYGWTEVTE